jgi:hypothetical protein
VRIITSIEDPAIIRGVFNHLEGQADTLCAHQEMR